MSKKVFIITRHAINNYGSLLQSYASLKIFEDLGFEPYIIDYISKNETIIGNLKNFASLRHLHGVKKIIYMIIKLPEEAIKNLKFKKQRRHLLSLTRNFNDIEQMANYFKGEILCSGSDQLWGRMPNNRIDEAYFLKFADETNKKIALSSSFGRYDFCEEDSAKIVSLLEKYDFITVREKSAKDFLEKYGIFSYQVLDPTLMVSREVIKNLAKKELNKSKYVLVYKLRHDSELDSLANKLASKNNFKIIYVTNSAFIKNSNGKTKSNRSLEYVLSLIRDAQYVITDSFHATVLSTIFKKEFFTHLPEKTNVRIIDYLNQVGLKDRYYYSTAEIDLQNIKAVDYNKVHATLDKYRSISLSIIEELANKL